MYLLHKRRLSWLLGGMPACAFLNSITCLLLGVPGLKRKQEKGGRILCEREGGEPVLFSFRIGGKTDNGMAVSASVENDDSTV
jgi:predicted outer membrane lipoprotein